MNPIRSILISLFLILLSGCASLASFSDDNDSDVTPYVDNPKNKIFLGTRISKGIINRGGHQAGFGAIIMPLSIIGDVIFLPYTIPVSIYKSFESENDNKDTNLGNES